MKRIAIIGIISAIVIVGIVSALSIGSFSMNDGSKEVKTESASEDSEKKNEQESKPIGRNLSIELEEKMGLSTP